MKQIRLLLMASILSCACGDALAASQEEQDMIAALKRMNVIMEELNRKKLEELAKVNHELCEMLNKEPENAEWNERKHRYIEAHPDLVIPDECAQTWGR